MAPENIILPPLHLKLGYMKQFVKRLNVDSEAFHHIKSSFPRLSEAKIKEGNSDIISGRYCSCLIN